MQKPALILSRDWEQYQTLAAAVRPIKILLNKKELERVRRAFLEELREARWISAPVWDSTTWTSTENNITFTWRKV